MYRAASPETVLGEKYALTHALKSGAAAFKALGHDRQTGAEVFVKAREREASDNAPLRTRNEANKLASLHHPQIPRLVEADPEAVHPYIVTERKPGTLYPAIWLRRRPNHNLAAKLCMSALDILGYVHEQGVVHRDVKASNLVMQWGGAVSLVDFELALSGEKKPKDGSGLPHDGSSRNGGWTATETRITSPDGLVGTIAYMAPEQVRGAASPASDIYAMGAVMYELTYGRLPFETDDEVTDINSLVRHKMTEPGIDFSADDRQLPGALRLIMERATQTEPSARYGSAAEMAMDIGRYLSAN